MEPLNSEVLARRISAVKEQLASASEGRYPPPRIIAVTKTHPVDWILPLEGLGIREIGENRVQEVREKAPALDHRFSIHLIGRLQTNKVKYIMHDVSLIQSLDRMDLAREINRQAEKNDVVMPCLVQVSPVGEEQKGGILEEDLRPFLHEVSALPGLHVCGLMAVMPAMPVCSELDHLFEKMRRLFDALRLEAIPGIEMNELSMGMSGDYVLAARHGATMVRVGSALFGPRETTHGL